MKEERFMIHLDLTCGSLEYTGETLPLEVLQPLLELLAKAGLIRAAA